MLGISCAKGILSIAETLCIIIGAVLSLKYLIIFLFCRLGPFLRPRKNLLKRYGEGSWVLVTGGTAGLGKAFCFAFAARGFNVCLIARNPEKIKTVCHEIKEKHPNIEIKSVVADFTEYSNEKLYDNIMEQIDSLDISVLVNNVGTATVKKFVDCTESEITAMTLVNTLPAVMLTRKLINRLSKRLHKSAIINVASSAALAPVPYFVAYGMSKIFNKFFALSLEREFRDRNIEMLCLMPFLVNTKLTTTVKQPKIKPETCVEGCLRDLGNSRVTYGSRIHNILGWGFEVYAALPKPIFDFCMKTFFEYLLVKPWVTNK